MLHPSPLIKGHHSIFIPCSLFSHCFLAEVLVVVTVFLFIVLLFELTVMSLKLPRMRGKDDYLEGKVKPRETISYFEIGETHV